MNSKTIYRFRLIITFLIFTTTIFSQSNKILITEFMAVNSNNIVDEDNEHSDWIELYNNTDEPIDLNGWYLTDDAVNLIKWKFPSVIIQKNGYLVVFASDKNRKDPTKTLHTNFKLSGSGEYLGIIEPDLSISYEYSPLFPGQRQDVSFGIYHGQLAYFGTATPGSDNVASDVPFAPVFSRERGFYDSAFNLSLSIPGGTGSIYYSINGTRPTATNATLYTGPIRISTSTPLSAVTINSEGISSEIITNTYIFITDVVKQPVVPAGYPNNWKQAASGTTIKPDYAMDPNVCNSTEYKNLMEPALKALPTMNIVTTVSNLFSDVNNATTGGIYIYSGKPSGVGIDWVRPTSIEYFDPNTGKTFQINCQLKLHGGNSRNPGNALKHGFEVTFKSAYGPSKLNFDIFEEKNSTKEFNSLVLRGGYNYSWALMSPTTPSHIEQRLKAQYLQDPWAKSTQLAMGQLSGRERFVHLYINGLYWGMYNIAEEYNDDFMESYVKGKEEEFDVIKEQQYGIKTSPTNGNYTAWIDFLNQVQTNNIASNVNYQKVQGKNENGSVNPAYSKLLNVDNYTDYMLLHYYLGNLDWDKNNWCAARNRVNNEDGFQFLSWDSETTMTAIGTNMVSSSPTSNNPTKFITYLIKNLDFKVNLADRIQKHLINTGGALTPAIAAARYTKLADEIDLAIIAESARWGDCSGTSILYTRNNQWIARKTDLLDNYFPYRTDTVIKQLRAIGYFPKIDAPTYTHAGGAINSTINLGMSTNSGSIYYSLDGSDPRTLVTGDISTSAKPYSGTVNIGSSITVKARAKSGSEWSAISELSFEYTEPNAIQNITESRFSYSSFPNPFYKTTQIQLNVKQSGSLQIDIYSIEGRLIKQVFNGNANVGLNRFDWTPTDAENGLYICKINFEGEKSYLKLVKK